MATTNPNGSIGFPGFNATDLSTWIPTFGLWCGPNWSAGERNTTKTYDQLVLEAVARTVGSNGVLRESPVDTACKFHDLNYLKAQGQPNETSLKLQADIQLERDLANLNWSDLNSTEKTYATLMALTFDAKIAVVDVPGVAIQSIRNTSTNLLLQINTQGGGAAGKNYTDTNGNQISCQQDANGNLILNCTQNGQTKLAIANNDGTTVLLSNGDFTSVQKNGTTTTLVTDAQGTKTLRTTDVNGQVTLVNVLSATASFISLVKAIQSGKPIPIAASAANDWDRRLVA